MTSKKEPQDSQKTTDSCEKIDTWLIFRILFIYSLSFGLFFLLVLFFKRWQVNQWLNGQSYYLRTPLNKEIAEKAIKINSLYQPDDILNEIQIKLIEYPSLDTIKASDILESIIRDLTEITNNNNFADDVNNEKCFNENEAIQGSLSDSDSEYQRQKKCSSLKAISNINDQIKLIEINFYFFKGIKNKLENFEDNIEIILKDDSKEEVLKKISEVKEKIKTSEQEINQNIHNSISELLPLLKNNNNVAYENSLIDSLCQSSRYKLFCSEDQQSPIFRFNWIKRHKWEEFEKELQYIVILSNLQATPAQKERITKQLNSVKQHIKIAKDKLIFYNSLDFTTSLFAWPLALVSGILFVFLSKDGFEKIFKQENSGAQRPATLFIVNSFWLILITQVPLLFQFNLSHKYHLVTLIESVNIENRILSYIATNGYSDKNFINKNSQDKAANPTEKNSIFIIEIDQKLLQLISRFDPGINSGLLPDTSQYLLQFGIERQEAEQDTPNDSSPTNSDDEDDFSTGEE
ncbi:hypothetical protein ACP6PL_23710 [Dapis sp. BLCC M126]|uniref:hypothetical protein n=1 Tax=Dapis sp. BLCC M126 TaxID=3400189 RepID=UPI003CEEE601